MRNVPMTLGEIESETPAQREARFTAIRIEGAEGDLRSVQVGVLDMLSELVEADRAARLEQVIGNLPSEYEESLTSAADDLRDMADTLRNVEANIAGVLNRVRNARLPNG
jgi:hypothetical protein